MPIHCFSSCNGRQEKFRPVFRQNGNSVFAMKKRVLQLGIHTAALGHCSLILLFLFRGRFATKRFSIFLDLTFVRRAFDENCFKLGSVVSLDLAILVVVYIVIILTKCVILGFQSMCL